MDISKAEKMRKIVSWLNFQNEGFNDRFKSIADIEKAYDYCSNSEIVEFLDSQTMYALEEEDFKLVTEQVEELLGYNIFKN